MASVRQRIVYSAFHVATRLGQVVARLAGRTRRVDIIIYKVDRLGDWLLVQPSLERVLAAARQSGQSVVIWASRETDALRELTGPDCPVESIAFEPRGRAAKIRRTFALGRLLSIYRAGTVISFRHAPEPLRDVILSAIRTDDIRALSWRMFPGPTGSVPHEIYRHHALLAGLDLAPPTPATLLPSRPAPRVSAASGPIVLAPYSSAALKDWNIQGWIDVARALGDRGLRWELWVGPDQRARAGDLARRLQAAAPDSLYEVRSGSLRDLTNAINGAQLILTVDTLAAHLAVIADAPMVAILGGGQHGDFAPWQRSARQRWVTHPLPCYNCGWACHRPRVECIQDISPAAVIDAIGRVADIFASDARSDPSSGCATADRDATSPLPPCAPQSHHLDSRPSDAAIYNSI